jgi:hypothetical protein
MSTKGRTAIEAWLRAAARRNVTASGSMSARSAKSSSAIASMRS